jgi:phage shock protein C
MNKKLYRDEYHRVLGGVCSGLAEYFDMDVTIVRLLFAFTVVIMGVGVIPYIVLWIVLPRKGYVYNNFNNPTVDYRVPPQQPDPQNAPPKPANPFGNNPFGNNPYSGGPFGGNPVEGVPPKPKSHAGIIVGVVLVFLGAIILIDNYDLIPDFDFTNLWPVILVIVGASLIVSGQTRQVWAPAPDKNENKPIDNPPAAENTSSTEE